MTSPREGATCAPTPHDLSQLAWTRRQDPVLAMEIAAEAGRQSDSGKPETPTRRSMK